MPERENVLLTIDELCSALMIGRNTAYRLLNSGAIKAFRIGRCWKIPQTAVNELLRSSHAVL